MSISNTDIKLLSYLAGFFDGEGTVCISRRKDKGRDSFDLRICVGQKDIRPLELFKKRFGGRIYVQRRKGNLWIYQWECKYGKRDFLKAMIPHLRFKKEEAKIAEKYLSYAALLANGRYHTNLTPENHKQRVLCYLKCKQIKRDKVKMPEDRGVHVQAELLRN